MAREQGHGILGTALVAGAVGAAVGALVALLLAPKPGKELRAELGEKAKEAGEKVKEAAGHAREKASQWVAQARERLAEIGDECSHEPAAEVPAEGDAAES